MGDGVKEAWGSGGPYEQYVGRWSRVVAREFLEWLGVPPGQAWGDVGCGTGALVECILANSEPKSVLAIDRSEGFVAAAQGKINDKRVRFEVADATALPWIPFLGKQGAAPTYVASLDNETRDRIREVLKARLVASADGSIPLMARAWAVQGTV